MLGTLRALHDSLLVVWVRNFLRLGRAMVRAVFRDDAAVASIEHEGKTCVVREPEKHLLRAVEAGSSHVQLLHDGKVLQRLQAQSR